MAKKYSRVSAHFRNVGHSTILVRSHIRKNPKKIITLPEGADGNKCFGYNAIRPFGKKEAKMPENEEQTEPTRERPRRKHVYVDIQEANGHYLLSFSHGPPMVFHSMTEFLEAIREEVRNLSP